MISYSGNPSLNASFTVAHPKILPCPMPATATALPVFSPGHIDTSWGHGFGNGYYLYNTDNSGRNFPRDIRVALHDMSAFDARFGSGEQQTFDQGFCDLIEGYPIYSVLWHKVSVDETRPVISLVANNSYNFVTNPEYIDGVHWKYAAGEKTGASGFSSVAQGRTELPLEENVGIGESVGPSIISTVFKITKPAFVYAYGTLDWAYDDTTEIWTTTTGHSPSGISDAQNGSVPFSGIQVYLAVSNISYDDETLKDWGRGIYPALPAFAQASLFDASLPSGMVDVRKITYYPLLTNSLNSKAVYVPVREGQYVFVCMFSQQSYKINSCKVDLRVTEMGTYGNDNAS